VTRLDTITLTGLRAAGFHGVFEHERRDGQDFIIDVTVHLDFAAAAAADELEQTVHYGVLAEAVVSAVERDPVDLIETVAERVANVALAYPAVQLVDVTIHKPGAPITVPFVDVAVSIQRARAVPVAAVLSLGANLGDREATLREAARQIADLDGVTVSATSTIVETPALTLAGVDESAPAYLNAAMRIETTLTPDALLAELNAIENAHGRTREVRWGARTLDIDIVVFGDVVRDDSRLTLPHPRVAERSFVLEPWLQLDPAATLPGYGPVSDLLAATGETVRPFSPEALL
jgi:dihydroneopterin aldolase/2-amino-4-hydroxy-6-hydroxymethyldihydropteridine diphosphokinase